MNQFEPLVSLPFRTVNHLSPNTSQEKKILFLTYRFPYPVSGGDRLKSYHTLRHLSEIGEVDLISLDEWATATHENLQEIKKFAHTVTVVPFVKSAAIKRAALSLFSHTPVEIAWYYSPQMQEVVDIALQSKRYDLICCFFIRTAAYVTTRPYGKGTPKILIAEDSRLLADERASKKFSLSAEYFVRKIDAAKLRTFEPQLMNEFDMTTFVAKPDESRIHEEHPNLATSIFTNGVDVREYAFYEGAKENAILFAGHLGIYHNKLTADRILRRIYPKIKEKSPGTRLIIAGIEPDESLKNLIKNTPGAELHANSSDLKPYYRKASLFLHPQSVGAGIQNKLLESMALGTPVVTTEIGASGISGIVNHRHLVVSDSDEDFVTASLSLLAAPDECRRLAQNARKLIEDHYTWEKVFDSLDKIIVRILPNFFVGTSRVTSAGNGSH